MSMTKVLVAGCHEPGRPHGPDGHHRRRALRDRGLGPVLSLGALTHITHRIAVADRLAHGTGRAGATADRDAMVT